LSRGYHEGGGFTIIKPAKCLEVDSFNVFVETATFSGNIKINAFFFCKIKTAFLNSTGLKNEEEL